MTINGTDYLVNTVNSGTSITLNSSAGTQTNVNMSVYANANAITLLNSSAFQSNLVNIHIETPWGVAAPSQSSSWWEIYIASGDTVFSRWNYQSG